MTVTRRDQHNISTRKIYLVLFLFLLGLSFLGYQYWTKQDHHYSLVLLFEARCSGVSPHKLNLVQAEESRRFDLATKTHHFSLKQKLDPGKLLLSLDDTTQAKIYNYSLLDQTLAVRLNCVDTSSSPSIPPPEEAEQPEVVQADPEHPAPSPPPALSAEEVNTIRWEGYLSIHKDLPLDLSKLSIRYANQEARLDPSGSFFFDLENPQANGQVQVFNQGTFIHAQFFPTGAPIRISLDPTNVTNLSD